jgi:hypothetical protein
MLLPAEKEVARDFHTSIASKKASAIRSWRRASSKDIFSLAFRGEQPETGSDNLTRGVKRESTVNPLGGTRLASTLSVQHVQKAILFQDESRSFPLSSTERGRGRTRIECPCRQPDDRRVGRGRHDVLLSTQRRFRRWPAGPPLSELARVRFGGVACQGVAALVQVARQWEACRVPATGRISVHVAEKVQAWL